jgi:hypothetical protein
MEDAQAAFLQMEITSWSCEVRQLLSRMVALGKPSPPPSVATQMREESPESETGGSPVFTVIRNEKCPLLWNLRGGGDLIIQRKGKSDSVMFPHTIARFDKNRQQLHSLDALVFVQMIPLERLETHPTNTIKELDEIQSKANKLLETRKQFMRKLGETRYQSMLKQYRADQSGKCHKLGLQFIHKFLKDVEGRRKQSKERIQQRYAAMEKWLESKYENVKTLEDKMYQSQQNKPVHIPLPIEGIPLPQQAEALAAGLRKRNVGMPDASIIGYRLWYMIESLMANVAGYSLWHMNKAVDNIQKDFVEKEDYEIRYLTSDASIAGFVTNHLPKKSVGAIVSQTLPTTLIPLVQQSQSQYLRPSSITSVSSAAPGVPHLRSILKRIGQPKSITKKRVDFPSDESKLRLEREFYCDTPAKEYVSEERRKTTTNLLNGGRSNPGRKKKKRERSSNREHNNGGENASGILQYRPNKKKSRWP